MPALTTKDVGKYRILTTSGAEYQLDLDDKKLTRTAATPVVKTLPIDLENNDVGEYEEEVSLFKTDTETVPLINVIQCEIGSSAFFLVTGSRDDVVIIRHTSPVVNIEKI